MADPKTPTRDQIAAFVGNNPETVRAIERLFKVAGQLTPEQVAELFVLVEGAALAAGVDATDSPDYLDLGLGGSAAVPRRLRWNADAGAADMGLPGGIALHLGQMGLYYAKNTSGAAIAKGAAVMFTGAVGASGKLTFGLAVADGTASPEYMMGVATETVANNGFGYVTAFGLVRGFNTTGAGKTVPEVWADGDVLYFDPAYPGELTKAEPDAPNLVLPVAVVVNAGTGSGSVFVRMKTGERLNGLHDVYAPAPTDGQALVYVAANSRWEAATAAGGSGSAVLAWMGL